MKHVLDHLVANSKKAKHSVFNVERNKIIGLIDEAWAKRGAHVPGDPGAYVIDMGRAIGTAGERHIRVIVRPGTTEVISAYRKLLSARHLTGFAPRTGHWTEDDVR